MAMYESVSLALIAAALANGHTRLKQRLGYVEVEVDLATQDLDASGADINTVEAQADTFDQVWHIGFAQVRAGVSDTGLRAFVERTDGGSQ
jgi:hypothetical protein